MENAASLALFPVDESEAAASVGDRAGAVQPHPTSGLHHPSHAAGQSGEGSGRVAKHAKTRYCWRRRCWRNPVSCRLLAGEGAPALQAGLRARGSTVQRGGRSGPVSSTGGVGASIAPPWRRRRRADRLRLRRESHRRSSWLLLLFFFFFRLLSWPTWQRLLFVRRSYVFQPANSRRFRSAERDDKFSD